LVEAVLPVLAFAFVATFTPGGGTTIATALGMQVGYAASLPFFMGNVLSAASLIGLSALGIGVVMQMFPLLELILKMGGTAYLLYLSYLIATAGTPKEHQDIGATTPGWRAGAIMSLLNPKVWTLAVGASATFSTLVSAPEVLGLLLAGSFVICGMCALSFWCLLGAGLRQWIKSDRTWQAVNILLALLLAATVVPIWVV